MSTYRFDASYDFNYENGPVFTGRIPDRPPTSDPIEIMGLPLGSRVGVFSGPLLNARWIDLYARLGFDLLAYKTVRSSAHSSHPLPNCAFIEPGEPLALKRSERPPFLVGRMTWPEDGPPVSMTNSFGMPSRAPETWTADVGTARKALGENQALIVSVVGKDVGDYATTARMAVGAGAQAVEVNLSCPNVKSGEGSIFMDASLSEELVAAVRQAIGKTPLIVKVGYIEDDSHLDRLLTSVGPHIDAVSGINTVSMEVRTGDGLPLLGADRLTAGICGNAIRACGLAFSSRVAAWRDRQGARLALLMGGGVLEPSHIDAYLDHGADVVMVATGAMLDPLLAVRYRGVHSEV